MSQRNNSSSDREPVNNGWGARQPQKPTKGGGSSEGK